MQAPSQIDQIQFSDGTIFSVSIYDTYAEMIADIPENSRLSYAKDTQGIYFFNLDADSYLHIANSVKQTYLTIIETIESGETYTVNASGTGYTKSGDDGNLDTTETDFNNNKFITIMLNSERLKKGSDVEWVSDVSFILNRIVDSTDELEILS